MLLEESWKITIGHLKAAHALLPSDLYFEEAIAFEKEYREYLAHNELELAMNSLDDAGLLCDTPNEYWHQLELAATNMGLTNDSQRFKNIQST